jgi:hypothetical protein
MNDTSPWQWLARVLYNTRFVFSCRMIVITMTIVMVKSSIPHMQLSFCCHRMQIQHLFTNRYNSQHRRFTAKKRIVLLVCFSFVAIGRIGGDVSDAARWIRGE